MSALMVHLLDACNTPHGLKPKLLTAAPLNGQHSSLSCEQILRACAAITSSTAASARASMKISPAEAAGRRSTTSCRKVTCSPMTLSASTSARQRTRWAIRRASTGAGALAEVLSCAAAAAASATARQDLRRAPRCRPCPLVTSACVHTEALRPTSCQAEQLALATRAPPRGPARELGRGQSHSRGPWERLGADTWEWEQSVEGASICNRRGGGALVVAWHCRGIICTRTHNPGVWGTVSDVDYTLTDTVHGL